MKYQETNDSERATASISVSSLGKMATSKGKATMRSSSLFTSVILLIISLNEPKLNQLKHQLVEASTLIDAQISATNTNATATLLSTIASRTKQPQPTLASFSTPNQAINITHLTYDPLYDTIYIGATNTIYQLNGSDLAVHLEESTGPVSDNPNCGVNDCQGFEDNMKPTQNINKVLVIDYKHKKLVSCGSTKQGACRRHQLNNIAQKDDLTPMAVAANDDNSSTFAFIAPARYTYDPSSTSSSTNISNQGLQQQQQVLYVGATYTKVGQSRELLVPAIGTRMLDDGPNLFKLYENSFLDSARIDINSHLRDYFLVNYLYGFASSNYIYFITVQKKATSRDFEELGYHTRLARICITDSSYNSYTEVDLKCVPNRRRYSQQQKTASSYFTSQQQQQFDQPTDYPLLQDAILVDAGSQLLQSLAQSDQLSGSYFATSSTGASPDDSKVLLGVFSSARDHTQHAGDHSALCAFSLAQIEDKFNDNIHSCYTGRMQSRNMEYIAGNVQECPRSGQGGNVVNFCHETLKINGTIPIVSEASVQYYNTTLTAITATSHINTQEKNIYSEQLAQELAISPANTSASNLKKDMPHIAGDNNPQRQHTVVFVGTSSGHLKKILLNNATNGVEFEDVQLDTNPILGDIHLHSSGNHLIVATPYKVMKVPTHNCAQYTSCRECSQSRNPYCGWCLLKKSCTTKSECVSSAGQLASTSSGPEQRNSIATETTPAVSQQKQQPKWISSESAGKCIDLQSIVPDKIPMTSAGKVDLYIERLPRLPKEHQYKCIFNRSEQTGASQTPFGLSCPLPKLMDRQRHIQIEPGRDHAVVELAVRSSETNTDFLDGKITFFDCQRHTTCKDCLTANWGCNWCLNENVCLFNTSKCDRSGQQQQQQQLTGARQQENALGQLLGLSGSQQQPIIVDGRQQQFTRSPLALVAASGISLSSARTGQPSSNTISQVQRCPTFDVGHQQDILIADGAEKELSIRVKNMPQFKGAIKCVVEIENYEISLKARIQDERVICEKSNYTYAADVGLLNGQLKVIYSDNNIYIDRTNFTLYKCHLLGAYLNRPDCSLCQRIDARFNCAWCSGSCRYRTRCQERPESGCPPPRIDFVHPLSGPALGGTRVTIEGSNLGQNFEEIVGRVSIGNVPCKPIEEDYRPSNRIVCITQPLSTRYSNQLAAAASTQLDLVAGDILVGNKAGYSLAPNKFQFKSVYLRDHQPRYGPQSGGTRILLSGMNLDIGSSVQIFLDELPCLIEPNSISSEQIICRTTSSRQPSRAIKHLRLVVDEAQIVRDDAVFYYTADPIIHKIVPLRAYLAGGRPIMIYGANLTVVQQPRIAIHDIATGKKINESACVAMDDTRMQCPSPTVNLQMMDLEYSEQTLTGGSTYDPSGQSSVFTTSASSLSTLGKQQQQVLQQDESVRFKLSFIMDNVQQTSYPQLQYEIAYTSDPKLYPFASAEYKTAQELDISTTTTPSSNELIVNQLTAAEHTYQIEADTFLLQPGEPSLVLYGEHLRAAVSEYEITVTVGQDMCNLTQLSQSRLVCMMPLDHMASPTDEDGRQTPRGLPLVVVRIGFNLRYELGFVQYHPRLVEQIIAVVANSTSHFGPPGQSPVSGHLNRAWPLQPVYPNLVPSESRSALYKISNFIATILMLIGYILTGAILLGFVYSATRYAAQLKYRAKEDHEQRQLVAKVDQIERSIKNECRVASLALQGDLNELERHVDLSGIPILNIKYYIMKVFFPGMNNHPLLSRCGPGEHQQQQQALMNSPPANSADFPMEHFQRLISNKTFLINFINTLERQASFTIRDKVNVASLLMIVLMDRLDYATDVMKTLLFQLVERSVDQLNGVDFEEIEAASQYEAASGPAINRARRKLTRRASNLLNGLPISKRHTERASNLGKVVGGSASSLMQSTSVAAQMLLARVGHKTSPMQNECGEQPVSYYHQSLRQQQQQQTPQQQQNNGISTLDCGTLTGGQPFSCSEYMSTTTFNNQATIRQHGVELRKSQILHSSSTSTCSGSLSRARRGQRRARRAALKRKSRQAQLMLRRTDSIVEKMLTNWLALNMYDHFHGSAGQSLYMLFQALKCQLERGPIDAISGDAYYSLNEQKLLHEPSVQFEVVNLYVIVDTDILGGASSANLMLDDQRTIYDNNNHQHQERFGVSTTLPHGQRPASGQQYASSNTITLALRVLDCDTISQVKAKVLSALYRNSASSCQLSAGDVELSLRQHQPMAAQATQTLSVNQQQPHHFVTVVLNDDDFSSLSSFNGIKRLNTLRHYGVNDQAIMMLKRNLSAPIRHGQAASMLTDMLDDHYSNPYTEIQYGHGGLHHQPTGRLNQVRAMQQQQQQQQHQIDSTMPVGQAKSWHLIRAHEGDRTSAQLSEHSNDSSASPGSHSPSMMLLGNQQQQSLGGQANMTKLHGGPQFYHPSSSSTSSGGNVMDTHSTSVNSVSMMNRQQTVPRRQPGQQPQQQLQQPIYCQIDSISAHSQHGGPNGSSYYCQIGQSASQTLSQRTLRKQTQESDEQLRRMLTSKGTVQQYIDNFFKTILTVRPRQMGHSTLSAETAQLYEEAGFSSGVICAGSDANSTSRRLPLTSGACPPAVKWIFDLLDEAAIRNGISDQDVIHSWKSNAFLLRFWVNFVKNPNYILDVDKSNTLDASLSVIAQTLMDSCASGDQKPNLKGDNNRLIFAKDLPRYKELVKRFYQDVASMRPVSDQEMVMQMSSLSMSSAGKFDTNLALKELCVYAVNYGVEIMNSLNADYSCQQLELPQQLEHCFRSFAIFEAYQ